MPHAVPATEVSHADIQSHSAGGGSEMVERLQQLADLRAAGALTEKEFAAAKAKVFKG